MWIENRFQLRSDNELESESVSSASKLISSSHQCPSMWCWTSMGSAACGLSTASSPMHSGHDKTAAMLILRTYVGQLLSTQKTDQESIKIDIGIGINKISLIPISIVLLLHFHQSGVVNQLQEGESSFFNHILFLNISMLMIQSLCNPLHLGFCWLCRVRSGYSHCE